MARQRKNYWAIDGELHSTVTVHTDDEGNLSFSEPHKQQPVWK